jgi:hypothetical protein
MKKLSKMTRDGRGSLGLHKTTVFWFRLILPKNHFTEFFDRHFAEHRLTERSFDRNTIWPNTVRPKVNFIERSFDRKKKLDKGRLTEFTLDKNDIWPKKVG